MSLEQDDPEVLVVEVADEPEGEGTEIVQQEPDPVDSEIEKIALSFGWTPPKDFKGDPSKAMSARDFLAETPKVLKSAKDDVAKANARISSVAGLVAKLEANQRKTNDQQLDQALVDAVEAGDADTAKKIAEQIRQSRDAETTPAVEAFKERNAWFGADDEATAYATLMDNKFANEAGGKIVNPAAHFGRIEAAVKRRFPELFDEPEAKPQAEVKEPKNPQRAPLVAGGGRVARPSNGELTVATMSKQHREAARAFQVSDEAYVKSFNHLNKAEAK